MLNNLSSNIIEVPYPPQITPQEIINQRGPERLSARSPNAFFIYRKAYLNQLKVQKCKYKMIDVSPLAGASWKIASQHVKNAYKEIAREVYRILKDMRQQDLYNNFQSDSSSRSRPFIFIDGFCGKPLNHEDIKQTTTNNEINFNVNYEIDDKEIYLSTQNLLKDFSNENFIQLISEQEEAIVPNIWGDLYGNFFQNEYLP
ncbi:1219_t:CDS:2 [Diversispora eburnea]|uniref:1219_t:CDS:1 n=1 Tax=Diversispora eburnea TaxID=1213867 RepID=A0A9N8W4L3_9GLOM|nr:1219_t:CDS:2 [Diversispora eburnea]